MSDFHSEPTAPKARKAHRCIYCYGPIAVGEFYKQQTGFYDGAAYRNRYHSECWDELSEDGMFEFCPGEGEGPERLRTPTPQGQSPAEQER